MAENLKKVWQDIAALTESLQAKIHEADEKCSSMQNQLKESVEENSRLQVAVNMLKKKQCTKCPKLIECVEMLKKKLKEKENTISVIGKFFLNHNPESYAAASQEVNEVITSSAADNSLVEKSLSFMEEGSVQPTPSPRSPDRGTPEPTKTGSPVVEKKTRTNKRKFLCISSMRKNKAANGDPAAVSNSTKLDDEPKLFEDTENRAETADNAAGTPPPSLLASPEILTSMSQCNRSLADVSETPEVRKSRRSLDAKLASCSPEAKRKTPETRRQSKRCEPMDLEIAAAVEPLPEIAAGKEAPSKSVWNLKRSRDQLTNSKLKQMLLSTAVEKKVDISTSNEYKGGSAAKVDAKPKENVEETFFEPAVTSTHNDFEAPNPSKALAESTNKPRTPHKIDDSFDRLPSTSPKYRYQRDAIRKKAERWKLPGQECAKCADFYEAKRADCSDSQMRKLLNKCSRHRHKHPIQVYTPPGLWNPVFDDTDDEVDVKI